MPEPHRPAPALEPGELEAMLAYWRAANYLTVGQIYLQDNPLLRRPLVPGDIKPRLLGHWGTSPGLSLIYIQANRLIKRHGANLIYLAGPGHGGPSIVANVYLEGTYSEVYPAISQDEEGVRRLFRQFSTPGGIPSHVSVPTPGSIHEGGELGYVLVHAFGAVFDNPDLVALAVVGDGEAETGPLAGSWKGVRFLDPTRDGAVLPVLHLNGYKIAGPTVLGRTSDDGVREQLEGHGYEVRFVEGTDEVWVFTELAAAMDWAYGRIREIKQAPPPVGDRRWPAIVLRTPKGWTGPRVVDGVQVEGTFRAHQVPLADVQTKPDHLQQLEEWLRSYRPEEIFDRAGRIDPRLRTLAPVGDMRMGSNPHANGGRVAAPLDIPDFHDYSVDVTAPGVATRESTRQLGELLRDIYWRNPVSFRLFCPDETSSNRLGAVFEASDRCLETSVLPTDDHVSPRGRVMEVLSEHCCEGWLEGYLLTGRHGLYASYEAFAMISASMTVQHSKWLEEARKLDWRAPIASLNILLTSTCWRNDHNGFSHQGPGLIDTMLSKKGSVTRIYLPPDANCLLSVADHCLRSRDYVNLIVIDKQPQPQWLDIESAVEHCRRGASSWGWAGNESAGAAPDLVLACAGDIPTLETLAAADLLRRRLPELQFRVVNVVDLMKLPPADRHPHGMSEVSFRELFTESSHVVFAFHGYPGGIHGLVHGRPQPERFHVRGYMEEGTTTTPFDMVVRNGISRYHLVLEALRRSPRTPPGASELAEYCSEMLDRHRSYIVEHFEDMPEVRDWVWSQGG
ncbi:MAG TPA: phosphoketolase family protein [Candidatus Nitrosotalea sp.]|nr:phosphoketolase family protein [Candidatus Nitrosotalea sp.]